jgi:predicted nucleic acid-binding Zn ribbon protein
MKRLSRRQKTAFMTLPIAIGAMVAAWMLLPERYFFFFLISWCILVSVWEWYVGSRSKKKDSE